MISSSLLNLIKMVILRDGAQIILNILIAGYLLFKITIV